MGHVRRSDERAKTTVIGNDKENKRMATSYLSPGVYVEEVDRGSKPIEAVGTNTVGFLGESGKGPMNESVLITNWSQFVKTFGDFKDCSEHLAHAVYGFFNNGGSRCFIVNVGGNDETDLTQTGQAGDKKDGKDKDKPAPASARASSASRRWTRSPSSRRPDRPRRQCRTRSSPTARPARTASPSST